MPEETRKIRTAVVTGGHPFDIPAFHAVFRSFDDVDFYPQHLEDFTSDAGHCRQQYGAVVFYNMTKTNPGDAMEWYEGKTFQTLEQLGGGQGIFVLHHGLLAFPKWPLWSEVVGIGNRRNESYHMGQTINVHVAAGDHPVTRGLGNWVIQDETYVMPRAEETDGNQILLTTDHPRSVPTLAWARAFRGSRVLCYQGGHDAHAFANAGFRNFVHRGIQWLAGHLF